MEMSENFLLRVAEGLLLEVMENTNDALAEAEQLKNRSNDKSSGFWERAKAISAAQGLINELTTNLRVAYNLCVKVSERNPSAKLENGKTAKQIQSAVCFQFGLINTLQRRFAQAVEYYEESLALVPDQSTYFYLGLCLTQFKGFFSNKTADAIVAFQKCIEIDPTTDFAVKAGMELARLGKL